MRKLENIRKQKYIALIAHDNKKIQLINWIKENKETLSKHFYVELVLLRE